MSPPDNATNESCRLGAAERVAAMLKTSNVGSAPAVVARLRRWSSHCGADEVGVTTWTYAPQDRVRSFALIAKELTVEMPASGRKNPKWFGKSA